MQIIDVHAETYMQIVDKDAGIVDEGCFSSFIVRSAETLNWSGKLGKKL